MAIGVSSAALSTRSIYLQAKNRQGLKLKIWCKGGRFRSMICGR